MKEEVDQLLQSLQRLLLSCADHDILYDIFVAPADTEGYREALEDITRITGMIRKSGIGREELSHIVLRGDLHPVPALEGIVRPSDLVPLMGTAFSAVQEQVIRDSARRWAVALDPGSPGGMEAFLAGVVRPLTLADLLAPAKTRMLRFPSILLIQETAEYLAQWNGEPMAENPAPGPKDGGSTKDRPIPRVESTVPMEGVWEIEADRARTGGERPAAAFPQAYAGKDGIAVPLLDDPALFAGHLYRAVFAFLAANGIVPRPLFSGPVCQALFDLGIIAGGGNPSAVPPATAWEGPEAKPGGLSRVFREEYPLVQQLMEVGLALSGDPGMPDDIRTLFGAAIRIPARDSDSDRGAPGRDPTPEEGSPSYGSLSSTTAGMRAGHVLAGWAAGRAGSWKTPHEETEFSSRPEIPGAISGGPASCPDHGAIAQVLAFNHSVASRPAGRAEPGPVRKRELDRVLRESEQLLRVITGDYTWRAIPYRHFQEGISPGIALLPERHVILYDPGDLAYRSPGASLALLMEAWYRSREGPASGTPDTLFDRLAQVTGTARAVSAGISLHPGAARWMNALATEESDPVNVLLEQVVVGNLPLPDQFLAGALYETRTGERAVIVCDPAVLSALDATRVVRRTAGDPGLSRDEFTALVREKIWPVFDSLIHRSAGDGSLIRRPAGDEGSPSGVPRSGGGHAGPAIAPRGGAPRQGTSVPHSTFPSADTPGRVIEGEGAGLLEDDGFQVAGPGSGKSAGKGSPARVTLPGGGTTPGGNGVQGGTIPDGAAAPSLQGNRSAPGDGSHSADGERIREIAEELVHACTRGLGMPGEPDTGYTPGTSAKSKEAELPDRPGAGKDREIPGVDPHRGDAPVGRQESLQELARQVDELTGELGRRLEDLRQGSSGNREASPGSGPAPVPGKGRETEGLLKTSEDLFRAAGEFRKTVDEAGRDLRGTGSGTGHSRTRTGMTEKALARLMEAGVEFRRVAGAMFRPGPGTPPPAVRMAEEAEAPAPDQPPRKGRNGPVTPSFMPGDVDSAEVWESLSYFDSSYGDDADQDEELSPGAYISGTAEQRYVQGEQALTHEAARYLTALQERTRSEWESIEEKAERIRQIALFETNAVGEDDFAMYQRFYQPVAGMVGVARKNIQQALQKNRAAKDLTELVSGDDIDDENLAAVRTTMRIFRDRGRQEDRARWCLSLLLDASSSMHDETVAKKLESTIRTAILFGEALNRVQGITFEIAAFADTEYIPLKRYQDDWNIHQGCYLIRQLIRASGGTNDVGAVGSALDRMNRLRLPGGANRMIFIISDGQSGVGGREQMRKILARHRDVRIFGWGIGPDMEKIEETYRPYGTHVREIADLPRSLGEVLRRELGRPAMTGWNEDRSGTGADATKGEASCTE